MATQNGSPPNVLTNPDAYWEWYKRQSMSFKNKNPPNKVIEAAYEAQGRDELAGINDDRTYGRDRSREADTNADAWWQRYQDEFDGLYNQESPTIAPYESPDYQAPDPFAFDRPEPTQDPWDFETYDQFAQRGGYGDTADVDLSQYQDPNFYLNGTLPDYVRRQLEAPDIASPDFQGMFDRYTTGARGAFTSALQQEIDRLGQTAAGGNRLNSGFFDEDTGMLSRQLYGDYQNQANMAALDILGLQASDTNSRRTAATSRGSLALDAANLASRAGQSAADAAIERANIAQRNRSAQRDAYETDRTFSRGNYETDRTFNEDQWRDRRDTARNWWENDRDTGRDNFESDRTFGRNNYESDRDFTEDRYRNTRNYRTGLLGDAIDRATERSQSAADRYRNDRNDYFDFFTGQQDRTIAKNEAARERRNRFVTGVLSAGTRLVGGA